MGMVLSLIPKTWTWRGGDCLPIFPLRQLARRSAWLVLAMGPVTRYFRYGRIQFESHEHVGKYMGISQTKKHLFPQKHGNGWKFYIYMKFS